MEKLVYALWKGPENFATFNNRLLGPMRAREWTALVIAVEESRMAEVAGD